MVPIGRAAGWFWYCPPQMHIIHPMTQHAPQPLLHRMALLLPAICLLLACGLASMVLSSCGQEPQEAMAPSAGSAPPTVQGVPTIRVRLTSSSVKQAVLSTTGAYRILANGREVSRDAGRLDRTVCRRAEGRWRLGMLTVEADRVEIRPQGETLLGVGDTLYRGSLVLLGADDDKMYLHNHVDLESYLAGVLAKEMYPQWHLEAYRALAVAARTYAMYEKSVRGKHGTFDVWDSQRSQVYGGMSAETDRSWQAVRSTWGWVLAYGPAGQEKIFLAQYSACNGGYVNGASVLRDVNEMIPPLQGGQKDPFGKSCSRWRWSPVRISKPVLYEVLARQYASVRKLGGFSTVRTKRQTEYGHPVFVEVIGPRGESVVLRAHDLRLAMLRAGLPQAKRLYSMFCNIRDLGREIEFSDGRGFGHGVGLSQWGAQERAEAGQSAEDILGFYYPESKIFRAY